MGLVPAAQSAQLTQDKVVAQVVQDHPYAAMSNAKLEGARANARARRGIWDPQLEGTFRLAPAGSYHYQHLGAQLSQRIPGWGILAFAGYRRSRGKFPSYMGELLTPHHGKVYAGAKVNLWKDGRIDADRAQLGQARELAKAASCERDDALLGLAYKAAKSYWKWVGAGHVVQVQVSLLEMAKQREDVIRHQVDEGLRPKLAMVDNRRLMLQRRGELLAAQRKFQEASIELRLYTDQGRPGQAPEDLSLQALPGIATDAAALERDQKAILRTFEPKTQALAQVSPTVCKLEKELAAHKVKLAQAKNKVAPKLDLKGYVSRGWDEEAPVPADVALSVDLALPLFLRQARQERRAAHAKVQATTLALRLERAQVLAKINASKTRLETSAQQLLLVDEEVLANQTLAKAAQEGYVEGVGDLLKVNLREQYLAKASKVRIERLVSFRVARLEYLRALGLLPNGRRLADKVGQGAASSPGDS